MVGLQIVERGVIVVSGLSTRDHATKLVVKLENNRGRKRDGLFGQEFQVTAELLSRACSPPCNKPSTIEK